MAKKKKNSFANTEKHWTVIDDCIREFLQSRSSHRDLTNAPSKELREIFARTRNLNVDSYAEVRKWIWELYNSGEDAVVAPNKKTKKKAVVVVPRKNIGKENYAGYESYMKSPAWKKKREQALKYHGKFCHLCKTPFSLHVHHLHYDTLYKEKMEDLMVLCKACHEGVHERKF
jgi:hypothetical protein